MVRPIRALLIYPLLTGCLSLSCLAAEPGKIANGFELKHGDKVLVVRPQTADEAHDYLVRVLGDMDFFRANGYDVALPDHPAFAPDSDPPGGVEVFAAEVYDPGDFEAAIESLAADRETLLGALEWFATATDIEGFRSFDGYEVTLTLYGPGGSYDPETGSIVLFTTPEGAFKGGGGVHTLVHEMMHLAVEDGLVQRFGLSHWEKERLVDLLVQRELSASLPSYRLQSSGEQALDPYLAGVPLSQLTAALERYRSETHRSGR